MKPTIYLVGAIRDGREDDILWRERVISELGDSATILNPLGGKTFDPAKRKWAMAGDLAPAPSVIVKHDFWCVDHADIIIANMTSLSEGYPSIGSLVELGRATARGALIYIVVEPGYAGHETPGLFKLHPFLEQTAAVVFHSVEDLITFLSRHLGVLSGDRPHFDGVPAAL